MHKLTFAKALKVAQIIALSPTLPLAAIAIPAGLVVAPLQASEGLYKLIFSQAIDSHFTKDLTWALNLLIYGIGYAVLWMIVIQGPIRIARKGSIAFIYLGIELCFLMQFATYQFELAEKSFLGTGLVVFGFYLPMLIALYNVVALAWSIKVAHSESLTL